MADPFAQYLAPEPKGADPFAQYVTPDAAAPTPAPASAEKPSFLEEAGSRAKNFLSSLTNVPTLHDVGQSFKDLGSTVTGANSAVARAITSPVETFKGSPLGRALGVSTPDAIARHDAETREVMRGVNSNVPLANLAVEHMGGPAESSPEDTAAAPGARAVGALAAAPVVGEVAGAAAGRVTGTVGRIADRVSDAAGRAAERTFKALGKGAGESRAGKLEAVGAEAVGAVDKEYGITSAPDPRVAVKEAMAKVGASRDAAYEAIDASGEGVDLEAVSKRLDKLEAGFRKHTGTEKFAEDVASLRDSIIEKNGARQPDAVKVTGGSSGSGATPGGVPGVRVVGGSAGVAAPPELVALGSSRGASLSGVGATYEKIPGTPGIPGEAPEAPTFTRVAQPRTARGGRISVSDLQREIGSVSEGAYGGNYVNPKAAAIIQRRTASALRGVLDEHLETIAKTSPEAAEAVNSFYVANGKFQALKAMEPIIKSKAVKARFAPSFLDKLASKPTATLAHAAKDLAGSAVARIDAGLSKAIQAARPAAAGVADAAAPVARAAPLAGSHPSDLLEQLIARAEDGDTIAKAKLDALSRAPIVAARIDALRRKRAPMEARP